MTEKEKLIGSKGISRREFLKDAGIVVGTTAVGSVFLVSACSGGETNTVTKTTTQTITKTQAGTTAYICPYDNQEFDTLSALKDHLEAVHMGTGVREGLIVLNVNDDQYLLEVDPDWTLAFVLRNKLGLTATKEGCNMGECGTCTVLMDGKTVYSCLVLALDAQGKHIQTLEGLSDEITLHPIQQALYDLGAHQCGYCTPGVIMSAKALLDNNPNPTREQVREALSGNLCICGANKKVVEAILDVPRRL